MSGAEMVHTYAATMWPDGAIASWSDAMPFGRTQHADAVSIPLTEEPPNPEL